MDIPAVLRISMGSIYSNWQTENRDGAETDNEVRQHTGQCKRIGGCYNELVVAFLSTGGGVKGKKSIPVDFMIYL